MIFGLVTINTMMGVGVGRPRLIADLVIDKLRTDYYVALRSACVSDRTNRNSAFREASAVNPHTTGKKFKAPDTAGIISPAQLTDHPRRNLRTRSNGRESRLPSKERESFIQIRGPDREPKILKRESDHPGTLMRKNRGNKNQ